MKPYYDHGGIMIYHGDCREVGAAIIPAEAIILTDPPYGINHRTDYHARGRDNLAKCSDYAAVYGDGEAYDPGAVLGIGSARILWGGNWFADKLPVTGGWLVWDKERPDDLDQATCELAWTDCVKGVRRFRHLWNGMIRASEKGRGELVHPTQKPVALMSWCLSLRWTKDFAIVADPYMGSGAVLVAAKNLGRKAIGIEIEERYCEIAAKRLAQEVLF